jgi:hypothetical protein
VTRKLLDSAISGVNEGVEFGEHPAFTARYRLSGSDPQKVKSLFGAGVLEFLGQQEGTLFSVEKSGDWLVIYKKDVLAEPEGLPARLSEARSIRALFGGSALPPI